MSDTDNTTAPADPTPVVAPAAKAESIFDLFGTNEQAEKTGVWLKYGNAEFLLARAGGSNDAFTNALSVVMRPHARRLKLGRVKAKEANELAMGPFVDHVLLGWKNVVLKDGSVLPYSKDNAKQLLTDIPDLYGQLMEDAQATSTFAPEDISDIAGN